MEFKPRGTKKLREDIGSLLTQRRERDNKNSLSSSMKAYTSGYSKELLIFIGIIRWRRNSGRTYGRVRHEVVKPILASFAEANVFCPRFILSSFRFITPYNLVIRILIIHSLTDYKNMIIWHEIAIHDISQTNKNKIIIILYNLRTLIFFPNGQ